MSMKIHEKLHKVIAPGGSASPMDHELLLNIICPHLSSGRSVPSADGPSADGTMFADGMEHMQQESADALECKSSPDPSVQRDVENMYMNSNHVFLENQLE